MVIKANYYDDFSCIGSDCGCNCCHGWNIKIDDETADYYLSLNDEFGDVVKNNLTLSNDGYSFIIDRNEKCVALDCDGLCKIFKMYGEDKMSTTCKSFPREIIKATDSENDIGFYYLSLSCEQVINLLWNKNEPIRFKIDTNKEPQKAAEIEVFVFSQICAWASEILQDMNVPVYKSLYQIIYVVENIREFYKQRKYDEIWEIIDQSEKEIQDFRDYYDEMQLTGVWQKISSVLSGVCRGLDVNDDTKRILEHVMTEYLDDVESISLQKSYAALKDCINIDLKVFVRKLLTNVIISKINRVFYGNKNKTVKQWIADTTLSIVVFCAIPGLWDDLMYIDSNELFTRLSIISRIILGESPFRGVFENDELDREGCRLFFEAVFN